MLKQNCVIRTQMSFKRNHCMLMYWCGSMLQYALHRQKTWLFIQIGAKHFVRFRFLSFLLTACLSVCLSLVSLHRKQLCCKTCGADIPDDLPVSDREREREREGETTVMQHPLNNYFLILPQKYVLLYTLEHSSFSILLVLFVFHFLQCTSFYLLFCFQNSTSFSPYPYLANLFTLK